MKHNIAKYLEDARLSICDIEDHTLGVTDVISLGKAVYPVDKIDSSISSQTKINKRVKTYYRA